MRSTDGASSLGLILAGLAGIAEADVVGLPDKQIRDEVASLLIALNQLTTALAVRIGTFDVRGLSECDGLRTTRSWLVAYGRMSQGAASAWLARGRMVRELPALAAAAGRGAVSAEHLAKVGLLADRVGIGAVRDFDGVLAEVSSAASPAETQKACERILAHLDPDGADPDPAQDLDKREISFSRLGSMMYVRGRLDAEGGAAVMTAIDALMRPPAPDDPRTSQQRRADALVDLARGALYGGGLPSVGGVRPHLGILVTPRALLGNTPATGVAEKPDTHAPVTAAPVTAAPVTAAPVTAAPVIGALARDDPDPLTRAGIPPGPEPPWLNWIGEIPVALAQRIAAKHGNLPVAEAKDPHERHRRAPPVGFVEGYVDLGNENVGIRGVVQDVGGAFQVHRALVGRLLVIRAGSGPDRAAAHQAPVQRMAVGNQRHVVHAILGEHRGDRVGVPGDRSGMQVPFEHFLMHKSLSSLAPAAAGSTSRASDRRTDRTLIAAMRLGSAGPTARGVRSVV